MTIDIRPRSAAARQPVPHRILAIDPGTERSAWLLLQAGSPTRFAIAQNADLLEMLRRLGELAVDVVVIEQIESYGMAVGREVFETVRWAGRFEEAAAPIPVALLPRRAVKLAICASPKANDSNIRAALLDRYGGVAAGRKGGPLAGIAKDVWSALAIAVTYAESPVDDDYRAASRATSRKALPLILVAGLVLLALYLITKGGQP